MDPGVTEQPTRQVDILDTSEALFARAAEEFVSAAADGASADQMFTVALSGGSTPKALYKLLAREPYSGRVPWDRTQVFFSDERFVPLDSEESNSRMAWETLLSHVPIPERFVHRVPTENTTPGEAASIYEEGIRRILGADLHTVPSFDLILLGLGPDGHTASLFPGTDALSVEDRLVVENFVGEKDSWRITFTYPLIAAARKVVFLVEGAAKAHVVASVLTGGDFPAARVRSTGGSVLWLLDAAAASQLPADMRPQ